MLFLVSSLIIRSFAQVQMVENGIEAVAAKHLSALVGFVALGILMWPVMIKVWPAVRNQFRKPESWTRMILASSGLGCVLWLGQMLVLAAVTPLDWIGDGQFSYPSSPTYTFGCSNPIVLLLAIPVMSLLTPLIEEIINRGLILNALVPKGRNRAIVISAALFALQHQPASYLYAFVFGIIVAIQMLHYRTLWAVIITHGVANILGVVSKNCVDGYWLPGKITWGIGSPAPLIALSFLSCAITAWWLAAGYKVGAGPVKDRPDSF